MKIKLPESYFYPVLCRYINVYTLFKNGLYESCLYLKKVLSSIIYVCIYIYIHIDIGPVPHRIDIECVETVGRNISDCQTQLPQYGYCSVQ